MEIENNFFEITTPVNSLDAKLFTKIINQGINSELNGFTKSEFDTKQTSIGRRLVLKFHKSELPLLIKRLENEQTESALMWANDIKEKEQINEIKSTNKNILSKEFKRFQKITDRVNERLNEGMFDGQGGTEMTRGGAMPQAYVSKHNPQAGMKHYPGYGKTVNTFLPGIDSSNYNVSANLTSPEAISISIKRAIISGAPVNNMGFYEEINWNLNNMGFESVQPIEIKESLKKILKDK